MNQSCGLVEAAREPQVKEQFNLLAQEISDNQKIIEALEEKLSAVAFRTDAQVECGKSVAPQSMMVPLAAGLRDLFETERANNVRLRALLSAIEV